MRRLSTADAGFDAALTALLAHVRATLAGETPISARAASHLLSLVRDEPAAPEAAEPDVAESSASGAGRTRGGRGGRGGGRAASAAATAGLPLGEKTIGDQGPESERNENTIRRSLAGDRPLKRIVGELA